MPGFVNNSAPNVPTISPRSASPSSTSEESEESSDQTNGPPQDGDGELIDLDMESMSLEQWYCQEYDCGRSFLSKAHLDSHKFFHSYEVSDKSSLYH